MLIDCDSCAVRDLACGDCVVSVLLGAPPATGEQPVEVDLDAAERAAIAVLAGSGLVPPLRLLAAEEGGEEEPRADEPPGRRPRDRRREAG
jgi:hypothetical protein